MKGSIGHDGFTLLETLVALLIVALALGVAAQTVGTALRSYAAAAESVQAQELARRLILDIRSSDGADLRTHGVDAGLSWTIGLTAFGPQGQAQLLTLTITPRRGHDYKFVLFEPGRDVHE